MAALMEYPISTKSTNPTIQTMVAVFTGSIPIDRVAPNIHICINRKRQYKQRKDFIFKVHVFSYRHILMSLKRW